MHSVMMTVELCHIEVTISDLFGDCLFAFESGEQLQPVKKSLSLDMSEQPVRIGWGRISVNVRPISIKFVRIGIVSGYV